MKNEEIESLLTNVLRFFILLLVTTGIMIGMGIHFLLDYIETGYIAEIALVALICFGVIGAFILAKRSNNATAVARMGTLSILVIGLLVGMGSSILVGIAGSQMLVILMFTVVLVWGLWVFRKEEEK
jgi:hypothetical protein